MVERSYAADFMSTFVSMFTAFSNFSAFFSARLPTSSSFVRPAHNTEKGTPRSSTAPHQMRSDIVRCYLRAIRALIPIFHQPKLRGIYKSSAFTIGQAFTILLILSLSNSSKASSKSCKLKFPLVSDSVVKLYIMRGISLMQV